MEGATNVFSSFMVYAILAAFAENAFLNRAIGASNIIDKKLKSGKKLFWYAALLIFMTTITSLPLFVANLFLSQLDFSYIIIPVVYIILISAVYFSVLELTKKYLPLIAKQVVEELPIATFNCALMGGAILAQSGTKTFSQTLGYAVGVGIGYVIAVILVREGKRRMELLDIPKAFRGLPISLIYVGILCLVVYGITGKRFIY